VQRKRAPATALFFLFLAACSHHPTAPLAINDCRLDGTLHAKTANMGVLHAHSGDRRYDVHMTVMTLSASLKNNSDKTIVSTRLTYHFRFPGEKPTADPIPWAYYDTYWRIPPHRDVHVRWNIETGGGRPRIASQLMRCALWAATFQDGSTWAAEPGNVAGGEADRHHGPL
jgi:hypothetical protein